MLLLKLKMGKLEISLPPLDQIYTFRSDRWRRASLTHSSLPGGAHFERLEFLGDRVLGAVLADSVYEAYPQASEGQLSKILSQLISREQCAHIARALKMESFLKCASRIDLKRSAVLGNALEAWLGAIYQDGGFDAVREVVLFLWHEVGGPEMGDYKTQLQEWVQANHLKLPGYDIVSAEGPEHQCIYTVEVCVESFARGQGQGSSRKKAEHDAAKNFLKENGLI